MSYSDFWKEKKVAVVGLGPEGEMRSDIKFLLKQGVSVTLCDMRGKAALRSILSDLKASGLKEFRLGGVSGKDLAGYDLIILSPDVPRSAEFLKEARAKGVTIEYPDVLALKLAPPVAVVGVMGSCGKTAIISMLVGAAKRGFRTVGVPVPVVMDHESGNGSLALLPKLKKDGMVIVRMPDRLLGEYAKARMSPQVVVMAATPAVDDPFGVLAHQTYNSFIVTTDEIADLLHDEGTNRNKAKIMRVPLSRFPKEWGVAFSGEHEREDAALVIEAASLFKIDERYVRAAAEEYSAKKVAGGINMVKKVKKVAFYDDSSSERPEATLAALRGLSASGGPSVGIVLIMGGAAAETDYEPFLDTIPQYVKSVVLIPGSGTVGIRKKLASMEKLKCLSAPSVEAAVKLARTEAGPGDYVLFSPAFAAAGIDASRSLRGERYVKAVRGLW